MSLEINVFHKSRLKLNLLNGSTSTTYIGMLSEVSSGYVDASIGGFSTSLERFQLVEFSQSLVTSTLTIITKTPAKSDKVSYITRKSISSYVLNIEFYTVYFHFRLY